MNTVMCAARENLSKGGDARWSTLIGGTPPERQHVAEGWLFGDEVLLPPEIGMQGSLFFVVVIEGEVTWVQDGETTVIPAGHIAGLRDAEGVRLRRGGKVAHLVVWRFMRGTLREGMRALGLPPPGEALCWPIAPRVLTPEINALFLELRSSQTNGTARSWWYGSKLLELTALMHPVTADPSATPHAGVREEVRRALVFLQHSYTESISLADVAREAGMSPTHLSRVFPKEVGVSLSYYLRQLRMEKAAQLLRSGECNVTDAAMAVGYSSIGQFSGTFREFFGVPPGAFIPKAPRKL